MTTTAQSFCRRGHARPKNGWCRQCGIDRYNAIISDPVKREAYQKRKNDEERRRYERSQEYRDKKNGITPEMRAEKDRLAREELARRAAEPKSGAAKVAERLKAKADAMACEERYGIKRVAYA